MTNVAFPEQVEEVAMAFAKAMHFAQSDPHVTLNMLPKVQSVVAFALIRAVSTERRPAADLTNVGALAAHIAGQGKV